MWHGFVAHIKGVKSHAIIGQALEILRNLDHRGAVGADPLLGDGAGLLIQLPDQLFRKWAAGEGKELPQPGDYAVAMCFLPQDEAARTFVIELLREVHRQGRPGTDRLARCADHARRPGQDRDRSMPVIRQCFIKRGENCANQDAFERKLLAIRKQTQNPLAAMAEKHGLPGVTELYMPSFSSRTIVYKGLLLAGQVGSFYDDLRDPDCVSALGLVHQRFSTNTFPSWKLAHPFRFVAHNGEINTVRGNVNWMNARRRTMESELLGPDLDKMWPLIPHGQSDTASLDNALELLVAGGYGIAHAMMMLMPEAWAGNALMDAKRRAFYEYPPR
jgi:glutamate synthase (NADPH/NADH) large chain